MCAHKRLITLPWENYYPAKPNPHKPRHWNISVEIYCVQASAFICFRTFTDVFNQESEWTDSIAGLLFVHNFVDFDKMRSKSK